MAKKYTNFDITRRNIHMFYQPVEMPGGYMFDHVETLKKIDLYMNSKFESGERDSEGFRKHFFNVVKPANDVATKFVDLDTKDFILTHENPGQEMKVLFMQRDLKHWFKTEKFGILINQVVQDYPKYGSVVLKQDNKNKWNRVPLSNLRLDPSSTSLKDSTFVYEVMRMTIADIENMPWDQEAINLFKDRYENKNVEVSVYECYDKEDGGWTRTFKSDFLKLQTKNGEIIETPESQINLEANYHEGIVLFEEEVKEIPYRELHWEKVDGRWLGYGFTEYLFPNQIRINELVNIKAKGLYFTSLKLYQTNDEVVARNIFTDVRNGDILRTNSPITPVVNEERNLAIFNQEEARWDLNTQQKTFSFDVARGGDLPSQTPLGVARLTAGMVISYFELKRENLGMFFEKILLEDVLPRFKKSLTKEHMVKILGTDEDIKLFRELIRTINIRKDAMKFMFKNNALPTQEWIDERKSKIDQQINKQKVLLFKAREGIYNDVEYALDIVTTGEQIDLGVKAQSLLTAMNILGSNPTILQDKALRTVFFKLLELGGISPLELRLIDSQADAAQQTQLPQQLPQGGPADLIQQMQGQVAPSQAV